MQPSIIIAVLMASATFAPADETPAPPFHPTVSLAVEQAHARLWDRHVNRQGIILDYVGALPTPDDCRLGRPNAIGWRTPIANGAMFTGLYLPAACERARRSGDPTDRARAQHLAQGLMKCASVSTVPGFIARGVGADGKCHYPIGSDDQTHPWFSGLHAYLQSGIPGADERKSIVAKMQEIADALEKTSWNCPCEGAFHGQFRGGFQGPLFRDAVRYLHMLRIMYNVTGERAWLVRYQIARAERPAKSAESRAAICALGYPRDRQAIQGIDEHSLWIYVGSQAALAQLAALESDESLRAQYRAGMAVNAQCARTALAAYKNFDNADQKIFGHANWHAVYPNWCPQATQADAEQLAAAEDKAQGGKRKSYEARYMRNPLAAAAVIALAGDRTLRDSVERAICHFDYSRLYMSEFFFAECAYLSLSAAHGNATER